MRADTFLPPHRVCGNQSGDQRAVDRFKRASARDGLLFQLCQISLKD